MIAMLGSLLATLALVSGNEINPHLYPSKTASIVVIDFEAIRASGLFAQQMAEDFESFLQDNEHFRKLNEMLGVNLSDQTTSITICSSGQMGPPSPDGRGGDFLSISNGNFSYEKISKVLDEMAERGELSVFKIDDLPIYFNHRSREAIYFGVVDDGVMIASSKKTTIEDAIKGLTELRKPDETLMKRLEWSAEDTKDVEIKPSVYLAGVFPEEARKQLEDSPLREIAKNVIGYNLTIHLGDKVYFRGRLELDDEGATKRAEKMFNLFTSLIQTSIKNRGNRNDMLELFGSLEIKAEKKDLHFDLTAPKSLIEQVSENDRKDPNSPRNRMRQLRAERREREARGENPDDEKSSSNGGELKAKEPKPSEDSTAEKSEN